MTEEDKNFRLIILKLKTNYNLVPQKIKHINLDSFSTITKGDVFKINYLWKVDNFSIPVYLISIYNTYRLNIIDPGLYRTPPIRSFRYIYCYLEFNFNFPDSIIRPNSIADRVANTFTHFDIKLENKIRFNSRYILESSDKELIQRLLSDDLVELLESIDNLYLEVRDNKCVMKYLRPANYIDTLKLLDVANEILKVK